MHESEYSSQPVLSAFVGVGEVEEDTKEEVVEEAADVRVEGEVELEEVRFVSFAPPIVGPP